MYSVGATLFYLLTGHAPFEEGNMVKLLSRVLEETPPDPTSLRPDIPRRLARVILRCLAKTPADRLKSYADLRKALEPFSSESPSPATLALRFGAYLIDTVVLGSLLFPLQALAWGSVAEVFNQGHIGTTKFYLVLLVVSLLMALYFGLMEGLRGASLGKQLVRLRLQRQDGSLPGFPRAFLRAAVLIAIMSGPYLTITILWADLLAAPQSWVLSALAGITNIVSLVVLFWAARRHNGYAGLHGRASDTRVVRALATTKRPPLMLGDPSDSDPQEGAEALGPYHVIEPLGTSGSGRWFLAYDTKLLRRVWVHPVTPETPAVPPSLRNLNRHGRLRWITGRRSEDENWDAYEAPGGKALSALAGTPQSWAAVRFWLLDLAGEFKAAQAGGSTPAILSFDRVWITADGHAKLFDFPAPNADVESTTHEDPAAFLRAIGDCTRQTKPPLPGHARALLSPDGPQNCAEILEILRLSVRRPTHISRLRRSFISLSVSALPFLTIFFGILFMALIHKVQESNPKLTDLSSTTLAIQLSKDNEERGHLRRYLAHHYRQIVEDPATWRQMEVNLIIDLGRQQIAKDAVAAYPSLTPDEITAAEAIAGPLVKDNPAAIQNLPPIAPLIMVLAMWIANAAIPSLLMALIMRRGLVLMIFGTVVVNSVGEQASRGRALWRSIIVWSPFPVVAILTGFLAPLIGATALMILVGAAVLILTIYSHLRKGRSLPDRLAGTWLVPK
jgi:hypothetical protein